MLPSGSGARAQLIAGHARLILPFARVNATALFSSTERISAGTSPPRCEYSSSAYDHSFSRAPLGNATRPAGPR